MQSSPVDHESDDYKSQQAVRAGIWLGVAAFIGGIGLLLVLAGLSENDEGSVNAGSLLALVGVGFLAAGIRVLYLRRHRPTPEQQIRGHTRQQIVIGSLGLVMSVGATVGMVYFGSLIGDQPFDPGGFYPYLILAAMMYPVGVTVVVGAVRRARRLRRLVAQPAGPRLPLVATDLNDPNEPAVAIDGHGDASGADGRTGLADRTGEAQVVRTAPASR